MDGSSNGWKRYRVKIVSETDVKFGRICRNVKRFSAQKVQILLKHTLFIQLLTKLAAFSPCIVVFSARKTCCNFQNFPGKV
jgi:hypothetical protein